MNSFGLQPLKLSESPSRTQVSNLSPKTVVALAFGSLGQNHNDNHEAALALDISRRLVADYRKDKPIPRHIAFATRYLVDQHVVNDSYEQHGESFKEA